MKLLFGLTEEQMEKVFKEVLTNFVVEQLETTRQKLEEIRNIDIKLSDEEMARAIDYMKEDLDESVDYYGFAQGAIDQILSERRKKKQKGKRNGAGQSPCYLLKER